MAGLRVYLVLLDHQCSFKVWHLGRVKWIFQNRNTNDFQLRKNMCGCDWSWFNRWVLTSFDNVPCVSLTHTRASCALQRWVTLTWHVASPLFLPLTPQGFHSKWLLHFFACNHYLYLRHFLSGSSSCIQFLDAEQVGIGEVLSFLAVLLLDDPTIPGISTD